MKTTECQICGSEYGMRGFAMHLRGSHDTEMDEYLENHVESVPGYTRCEICSEPTDVKESSRGKFTTCSNECKNEYKRRNWQGENAPWHGKSHSEETKRRISEAKKKEYANPENHPMYGREHSEKTKQRISEIQKENFANGRVNPMKGKTHSKKVLEKIFDSWKDSEREKEMMEILDELGLDYTHQFFLSRGGTIRSYDFRIKGTDTLIEVDGDYWHGGPKSEHHFAEVGEVRKNDRFKDEFAEDHGFEVLRFWGSEVKQDPKKVTTRIQNEIEQ